MPTLAAATALLPDGWARDVRVEIGDDGRIAAVAVGEIAHVEDVHLAGEALLPAPANLHSHAFQRAMAGMTERRSATGTDDFWSWRELMYRFLDRLDPDDVEAIAAFVQMEMLEAGYAAVAEFHYLHHAPRGLPYAAPAELATRIVAAAATTGIGLTLLPTLYGQGGCDGRPVEGGQRRFANDLDGFVRLVEGAEAAIARLPADARLGVAPHSLRAVPADDVTALVALRPGAPFHLHAAEQLREVAEVEAHLGARPVTWLLDRQPVDASWCVVHATHMTPNEVAGLAGSGAVAGLCPLTEANLGDGVFPGRGYVAAGGRFGIGSDSHVRIALSEEVRTLEGNQRLAHHARNVLARPPASTGRTLYDAILEGGAQALGRRSGRIEVGAFADLLSIPINDPHLLGLTDDALLDAWLLAGSDRLVRDVWAGGRHVVRYGYHRERPAIASRYARTIATLRDSL